jgi:hypothetical protein
LYNAASVYGILVWHPNKKMKIDAGKINEEGLLHVFYFLDINKLELNAGFFAGLKYQV